MQSFLVCYFNGEDLKIRHNSFTISFNSCISSGYRSPVLSGKRMVSGGDGLSYTLHGDYYLPDLVLTGKLTEHLNQIDQEARKQVEIGGRKGLLFSVLCVLG